MNLSLRTTIVIVAICFLVATGRYIFAVSQQSNIDKVATQQQVAAERQRQAQEHKRKLAAQQEARKQKQLAWQAHVKRDAWNNAHPEEVARKKAAVLATQREQERLAAERAHREEAQRNEENRVAHACETANTLEREAARHINADEYQATYDSSMSGLHYNALCSDETDKLINKGYFMSFKAYAEHQLGNGDWRTDFNEANQLLVECQTTPGVYGTHTAALCETQEKNNISSETHWEMGE